MTRLLESTVRCGAAVAFILVGSSMNRAQILGRVAAKCGGVTMERSGAALPAGWTDPLRRHERARRVPARNANGHILIDGGMPSSASVIERSIRTLGFKPEDIRSF